MTGEEFQTLIKDMDDYQTGHVPAMLLMERATKGLKSQQARIEKLEAENARFKDALEATTQVLYTFWLGPATFTINGATKSLYDVINDAADALEKGTNDE